MYFFSLLNVWRQQWQYPFKVPAICKCQYRMEIVQSKVHYHGECKFCICIWRYLPLSVVNRCHGFTVINDLPKWSYNFYQTLLLTLQSGIWLGLVIIPFTGSDANLCIVVPPWLFFSWCIFLVKIMIAYVWFRNKTDCNINTRTGEVNPLRLPFLPGAFSTGWAIWG